MKKVAAVSQQQPAENDTPAIKNRINAIDVRKLPPKLLTLPLTFIQRNSKAALKQLNDNKKEVQLLRSECATLEHHATETTNDILKEVIEDIANLEKDFLKVQQADIDQINYLK